MIEACFQQGPPGAPNDHIIADCLAVGQSFVGSGDAGVVDERVILFVKLHDGGVCSDELRRRVKEEIRRRRTARHVPERVSVAVFLRSISDLELGALLANSNSKAHNVGLLQFVQIIQVQDIPYTLNGKRVEVPVKKVRYTLSHRPKLS